MKKSLVVILLLAFASFPTSAAEPSAFGAGNLKNPNPYGLTPNEEVILETKQRLQNVVVKSNNQANQVDSLRERIDGLQSIVESIGKKAQENKTTLQQIESTSTQSKQSQDELFNRLSEVVRLNSEAIEKSKVAIAELALVVDGINKAYVTKVDYNALVSDINELKAILAKNVSVKKSSQESSSSSSFDGMSTTQIADKAKAFYDKKYYTNAIEHYQYLIEKNYKPAHAHYMIGIMNYKRKNYAEAIAYFKKSATLYSEASYMPTLMLYTAVSMDKTGDKENAKTFYIGVIQKYPSSKEAKEAKTNLDLMK